MFKCFTKKKCNAEEQSNPFMKYYYQGCNCAWCMENLMLRHTKSSEDCLREELKQLREENERLKYQFNEVYDHKSSCAINHYKNAFCTCRDFNEREMLRNEIKILKKENQQLKAQHDESIISWGRTVDELKAQLQQAQLVHDCRKCGKDSYAFFIDGICPDCTVHKPKCETCQGYKGWFENSNGNKYFSNSIIVTEGIWVRKVCPDCAPQLQFINVTKCQICKGSGEVIAPNTTDQEIPCQECDGRGYFKPESKPQKCPLCKGQGKNFQPFGDDISVVFKCQHCKGSGILEGQQP